MAWPASHFGLTSAWYSNETKTNKPLGGLMKTLLLTLASIIAFSSISFGFSNGQIQNAVYDKSLRTLIDFSTLDGQHVSRFVKGTWTASQFGSGAVGTYALAKVKLPKNSLIKRSYLYSVVQPLGSATSGTTFSITCGNATVFAAADVSTKAPGVYFDGAQTGAASAFSDVGTSDCTANVIIGSQAYNTQGTLDFYIEYTTHD